MYCKRCEQEKEEAEFPHNKTKASGRGFYCNKCNYERLKEWREKNREKVRALQKRQYDKKHQVLGN